MTKIRSLFCSFFLVTLLVAGCSTTSVIEQIATPPQLSIVIQPIRTLKVLVVYNNPEKLEKIKATIEEASSVLKKQIGVELRILPSPIFVEWNERGVSFEELIEISKGHEDEFDIAIGFGQRLSWRPTMDTHAMNEIKYRRFLISESIHPWLIAHEVGHSFIFCQLHSTSGLMQPTMGFFLGVDDYTFTKEDREEALRNKWRKFGELVTVASPGAPLPEACR